MPAPRPQAAQPTVVPEAAALSRTQLISNIQRELGRRGFYDGAVDGIWGAKTDAATRDFVQAAGLKINPEASDSLLRAIVGVQCQGSSGQSAAASPCATIRSPS